MSDGKVVLITGASSGIGWAAAELLAAEGARLALAARRADRLKQLADNISRAHGAQPLVLPTDLRKPEEIERMVQATLSQFGRIDVLINNAGILRMSSFSKMSEAESREIFETNFWAVLRAVRAVAPAMIAQKDGHIINVDSVVGRRALPFMAAYAASKFALVGLTESIRLELAGPGVAMTMVYPGGVDTEMPDSVDRSRLPQGYPNHAGLRIPAGRVARAILSAIHRRPREVYVPWWGRFAAWLGVLSPRAADLLLKINYGDSLWK